MTPKQAATLARQTERHRRDAETSQATPEQLLADAWSLWDAAHRWPTKRYRVEGSAAGNSACVTLKTALSLAIRCGGQAKQVIPTRKEARCNVVKMP